MLTACESRVLHFRSEPIKATIKVNMLDRLVEIFCEVDDFCKAFRDAFASHLVGNGPGRRGPDPGLADAEIITLLLVLHSSGFKYWKNFYNSPMGEVLRRYFPGMPCCERFIALQQRAFMPLTAFLLSKLGKKRSYISRPSGSSDFAISIHSSSGICPLAIWSIKHLGKAAT